MAIEKSTLERFILNAKLIKKHGGITYYGQSMQMRDLCSELEMLTNRIKFELGDRD